MGIFLSLLPILVLIIALSIFKLESYKAVLVAFLVAAAVALLYFSLGCKELLSTSLAGVKTGIMPISFVIVSALFTYGVTILSGAMETIKESLKSVSSDESVIMLLIICGFGNFMEGMAGFGTAVAIPAALLVGMGISPLKAVVGSLIANTAPTAFGSVGVPIMTLSKLGDMDRQLLSQFASLMQLSIMAIVPFFVLLASGGWKTLREKWKLALLTDIAFLIPWCLSAYFLGCELPDILGGISVMLVLGLVKKNGARIPFKRVMFAWLPFTLVVLSLIIYSLSLENLRLPQGVYIAIAAFIGGLAQKIKFLTLVREFVKTIFKYRNSLITVCTVLALANIMRDAKMIHHIADSLVSLTGCGYPYVAPLVGALGGFVTGSGTSTSVLFGVLQYDTAQCLKYTPEWFAIANVMGAGIGKMICPQSIAIGAGAVSLLGKESDIFKKALVYFLPVIIIACLISGLFSR
jgi:lactate permease